MKLKNIKKAFFYYKKYGLRKFFLKILKHYSHPYNSFLSTKFDYKHPSALNLIKDLSFSSLVKDIKKKTKMKVVWITCDFNKGSGGHTTIFRFIKEFDMHGVDNELVIWNSQNHKSSDELEETLARYFSPMRIKITLLEEGNHLIEKIGNLDGDIVIGTDFISQSLALHSSQFSNRYIFLQDKEALFHEYNYSSVIADYLLQLPINFISAGKWLESNTLYKKGHSFDLGVDTSIFKVTHFNRPVSIIKIAIYSRWHSPRRGVELIWAIIEKISLDLEFSIEIHLFGQSVGHVKFPFEPKFKVIDHGVISPIEMSELFNLCHIGIAFSLTNYSLIPLEMKASGLEVFDLDTSANQMVFKGRNINLVPPIPNIAARKILEKILEIKAKNTMAACGLSDEEVKELNWQNQTGKVYQSIADENQFKGKNKFKVSVCIPIYRGSIFLERLIPVLNNQIGVDIELVLVETRSDQNVNKLISLFEGEVIHRLIDKDQFGHGKTRNYLASLANSEIVVFLTQDALPVTSDCIFEMASALNSESQIVASYTRHCAYPEHGLFVQRDIKDHFDNIHNNYPAIIGKNTKPSECNLITYKQVERFFSTNACAIFRDVLLIHKFPEVNYGEDQLWAELIIKEGYKKVYLNKTLVMHSHDYSGMELYNRTITDMSYHKINFGEDISVNFKRELSLANKKDMEFARKMNLNKEVLDARLERNRVYFKARIDANHNETVIYDE